MIDSEAIIAERCIRNPDALSPPPLDNHIWSLAFKLNSDGLRGQYLTKLSTIGYKCMRASKVYEIQRTIELKSGVQCRLYMDLFDVGEGVVQGLFLDRFRFSWIFFEIENPMKRVLIDCHQPFGVHVHFDSGPQESVRAQTLNDVREFFRNAIEAHFGEQIEV